VRYRDSWFEYKAWIGATCTDTPTENLVFHGIDGITELDAVPLMDESGDVAVWPKSTVTVPRWLAAHLRGVFEYSSTHDAFNASMYQAAQDAVSVGSISQEQQVPMWQHIVTGGIVDTVLGGTWEFMPGVQHPRNLTGCAFLASYEFTAAMNYDLCVPGTLRSIRHICPVSCLCTRLASECPYGCL
jgi:hypothetical protein